MAAQAILSLLVFSMEMTAQVYKDTMFSIVAVY